jgi:hypothetical protein
MPDARLVRFNDLDREEGATRYYLASATFSQDRQGPKPNCTATYPRPPFASFKNGKRDPFCAQKFFLLKAFECPLLLCAFNRSVQHRL